MFIDPRKSLAVAIASVALATGGSIAIAAVSVAWDFSPGNEHGWTTVNGVSWLDANGVEAGQVTGDGIAGYFGGVNTGNTRRAHDGAHAIFLYRSPILNFNGVDEVDTVLEIDWTAGRGNQSGGEDPPNPSAATSVGGGITSNDGQKGLALLNLSTGSYDAVYYHSAQGNATETIALTKADLTTAGLDVAANYRLDFYENDDGSWGWTRLQEVRLDAAALTDIPSLPVLWDFSDSAGGDFGWIAENGFVSFAADGAHASTDGTDFAADASHPTMIFRSPIINFNNSSESLPVIQVDFIGGQGNQSGSADPANPDAVLAFNGGSSDTGGQKGLAFLNLTTGNYDHVIYDSEDGGDDPETISLTKAGLTAAGVDVSADYRLHFFDNDEGTAGWTRLESVNLDAVIIPDPVDPVDPPDPGDTLIWDFFPGNENGWTTVSGVAWLDANGVEAGQAEGDGIDAYFGGINASGATRRAHDGAHVNLVYRSPTINFASVHPTNAVLEIDWSAGAGNQSGNPDPLDPAAVGLEPTVSTSTGSKGLGLLNLSTGIYDAVYYNSVQGGETETISLNQAALAAAGVSLTDNYQLDFFENDDGSWGWSRLQEIRIDAGAIGESSGGIRITEIQYSPGDNMLTLTWDSVETAFYIVRFTQDLRNWPGDLDDSISPDPGDQTTLTFDLDDFGLAGERQIFFRVERSR